MGSTNVVSDASGANRGGRVSEEPPRRGEFQAMTPKQESGVAGPILAQYAHETNFGIIRFWRSLMKTCSAKSELRSELNYLVLLF